MSKARRGIEPAGAGERRRAGTLRCGSTQPAAEPGHGWCQAGAATNSWRTVELYRKIIGKRGVREYSCERGLGAAGQGLKLSQKLSASGEAQKTGGH